MLVPIGLLSVGSVASGYLLYKGDWLVHWLEPVVNPLEVHHKELLPPIVVSIMAVTVVLIGVGVAILKYRGAQSEIAPEQVSIFTRAARKDLLQDNFNEAAFMRPGQSLVKNLINIDYLIIDGVVRGVGSVSLSAGNKLRVIQNGYVRSYTLLMVVGALALIATIWVVTA